MLFLHDMGYTFFDVNQLTYGEMNTIMDAWNQKQKDEELASKSRK